MKKQLRKQFSSLGWALLLYMLLMNLCVIVSCITELIGAAAQHGMQGGVSRDTLLSLLSDILYGSGTGYLISCVAGLLLLRIWKGRDFCRHTLWKKGRPMTFSAFIGLFTLFMGCQFVFTLLATFQEAILNLFGFSAISALENATSNADTFSMFLYAGLAAPVCEEILFRGLVLRTLEPWGKRFAVILSAFLFGIFHGNIVQTPYAFMAGIILGYAALEFNIFWAMVLHMFNNLVFSDMLNRILPEGLCDFIPIFLMILFAVMGILSLLLNRKKIRAYVRQNPVNNRYVSWFFSSSGVIVLILFMLYSIAQSIIRI